MAYAEDNAPYPQESCPLSEEQPGLVRGTLANILGTAGAIVGTLVSALFIMGIVYIVKSVSVLQHIVFVPGGFLKEAFVLLSCLYFFVASISVYAYVFFCITHEFVCSIGRGLNLRGIGMLTLGALLLPPTLIFSLPFILVLSLFGPGSSIRKGMLNGAKKGAVAGFVVSYMLRRR